MTTYIYTLSHPITGEVKYIGKTVNPKQRKHNHSNVARDKGTYKRNWINSLKIQELRPIFEIIDVVGSDWKFWEKYWISQFKAWGFNLCNYGPGGEGLEVGNQTSFKKGFKPWNTGKFNQKECPVCKTLFKRPKSSRQIACSHKCSKQIEKLSSTIFKKGFTPWNKNKTGIKLKPDKNVHQYDSYTGKYITTFKTAKQAANELKINEEGIGQACRGKAKSAGGFAWSYEKHEQIKISNNYKLKIKLQ